MLCVDLVVVFVKWFVLIGMPEILTCRKRARPGFSC